MVQSYEMTARILPYFGSRQASERLPETARIVVCPSPLALAAFALCLLLPYGRSLTRRSIGQALAYGAFEGAPGALYVIYAKPHALAIAEIEFRQVAMQMLLCTVLIH